MTKQDLDYPECPYCGTRVRMTSEIENMQNLDEYDRCLENEEAMYDAVINGNDNQLIELVEQGVNKI